VRVIDTCANLSATDTGAQLPHAPGFRFAINIDSAMLQVYAAAGETEGTGGTGWSATLATEGVAPKLLVLGDPWSTRRYLLSIYCIGCPPDAAASVQGESSYRGPPQLRFVLEVFGGAAGANRSRIGAGPVPFTLVRFPLGQSMTAALSLSLSRYYWHCIPVVSACLPFADSMQQHCSVYSAVYVTTARLWCAAPAGRHLAVIRRVGGRAYRHPCRG
jgi:hypothetical protein